MLDGKPLKITINEEYVIISTLDNLNFPYDVWRFKKSELTDIERIFVDNILSMATSMISSKKNTSNEGNNSTGN